MVHSLYTCQDSYVTVVTLSIASYSILYFEQILWLLPFVPLAMILFIFNNLHTRAKFERPQKTYVKNVKLVQFIMTYVPLYLD